MKPDMSEEWAPPTLDPFESRHRPMTFGTSEAPGRSSGKGVSNLNEPPACILINLGQFVRLYQQSETVVQRGVPVQHGLISDHLHSGKTRSAMPSIRLISWSESFARHDAGAPVFVENASG